MAESVIKNPNKKTLLNFTPVTGVTVVYNHSYVRDDGLISICLHLKINVNLKVRTILGQFSNYPSNVPALAIEGGGDTIQDGYVDCVVTGIIDSIGRLHLGDYVSSSQGFAEVTVISSYY